MTQYENDPAADGQGLTDTTSLLQAWDETAQTDDGETAEPAPAPKKTRSRAKAKIDAEPAAETADAAAPEAAAEPAPAPAKRARKRAAETAIDEAAPTVTAEAPAPQPNAVDPIPDIPAARSMGELIAEQPAARRTEAPVEPVDGPTFEQLGLNAALLKSSRTSATKRPRRSRSRPSRSCSAAATSSPRPRPAPARRPPSACRSSRRSIPRSARCRR